MLRPRSSALASRPCVRRCRLQARSFTSHSSLQRLQLTSTQRQIVERDTRGHVSVVGSFASGKTTAAAERVLWLHAQSDRRVLALSGRSTDDAALVRYVDHATSFHALERRGHRISGLMEWTQHTLEELGQSGDSSSRRVLSFGKMTAFLMHHARELPLRVLHQRLATQSSMQLRRSVADTVRFFTTLEAHGVAPASYSEFASTLASSTGEEDHVELAQAYAVYRKLQQRHDVSSWDGLVLDLVELFALDPHCLAAATREFTDVVVDDVHRMSPAMVKLMGLVVQQPHVQSSTSFSHTRDASPSCPRTAQLLRILQRTDVPAIQLPSEGDDSVATTRDRQQARLLASRVLTPLPKAKTKASLSPVSSIPIKAFEFDTFADESRALARLLLPKQERNPQTRITVLCPSLADAGYVAEALVANGVRVRGHSTPGALNAATRKHLFDEPGVDAMFSLLVALWSPSDTKHLYNVLRSEFFAFPPEMLSRIMEKHHRQSSHTTLVDVLTAFVDSRGRAVASSSAQDASLLQSLDAAARFLSTIKACRDQCHAKSVSDIVQLFLEKTGHMERLLDPQSAQDARHAIALAALLREIEAAQRIVQSNFVPFVVPYLVQLQAARVASISDAAEDEDSADDDGGVRVMPLSQYALDDLEADVDSRNDHDLVVLTAMRDAKFPGRLKRITWPLPTTLLATPLPVQTREEFLADAETLVYDAIVQLNPAEIVLTYATRGQGSSGKRPDKLSRVLEPLWTVATDLGPCPEDDGGGGGSSGMATTPEPASPPPLIESTLPLPVAPTANQPFQPTHVSYSQISEYTRCPHKYFLSRVLRLRDLSSSTAEQPHLGMMFGSAVHEAVASFALARQRGASTSVAQIEAFTVLEDAWTREGFLSKRQETFFLERARATLRGFVEREASAVETTREIVYVEKAFECRLGRVTDVPLKGVWDRVDRTPSGVVIREFKTNPSAQKRPKLDAVASESLQLKIYMVAYEQIHGEAPFGATLEVLGETEEPGGSTGFVAYAPEMREEVARHVDEAIAAMQRGEFDATPGFFECGMCPYASSACRAGVVESQEETVATSTASAAAVV